MSDRDMKADSEPDLTETTGEIDVQSSALNPQTACPNCRSTRVSSFFRIDTLPAHCALVMQTREEAVSYPRGPIELAACADCGFILNAAFEPELLHYSPEYEDSQHFSPRFRAFAESLIDRLVREYGIRNKQVVEIGCGKADFLRMLCEAGDNTGVGIDPASDPQRLSEADRERITLVPEFYKEAHGEFDPDLIVCRHSLEHIPETKTFLETVRASIPEGKSPLLFFEVPETQIILDDCRFWDVNYEHTSYFTPGSLGRLFTSCGFELLELRTDFDDQYQWLIARPTGVGSPADVITPADDLDDIAVGVRRFAETVPQTMDHWDQVITETTEAGKKVAVWTASSKCVAFLNSIRTADKVEYAIDINPHKHHKFLPGTGHEVLPPETLTERPVDLIILMNPIYQAEIQGSLDELGSGAELRPV